MERSGKFVHNYHERNWTDASYALLLGNQFLLLMSPIRYSEGRQAAERGATLLRGDVSHPGRTRCGGYWPYV